ncbi:MAG TPA: LLM class F420-dependent oxidoreductase [Ktedonobacteraceae bacterium]|nr:LLM class F420-dependent oxidoreductase [Ktedonobacteraceae bacterium]
MKVAIGLGAPYASDIKEIQLENQVTYVVEAERLGVDSAWSAEAWGYDAVTPLAYLAAKTQRIRLGTGIMQIGARTPAMIAMTALSMSSLSQDRFLLGLGVSGPQVMEGWHGVRFARPLQRTREVIDIVRMISRGERLSYSGQIYQLPLPDSEGKAIIPDAQPRHLPIYLATLGPKNLELTGELANGWIGTSFIPEHSRIFLDSIEAGARKAGRSLADVDIQVHAGAIAFSDNLENIIASLKVPTAFYIGAMGSRKHNFYNEVYQRAGYVDLAHRVQDLWLQGQRKAAIAEIPDELVLKTNLIGTKEMVRERLRVHRRAGVNTVNVAPLGKTLDERLQVLGQLIDLVKEVEAEDSEAAPSA